MNVADIKQKINELCFHIFFQTEEGKTLLQALEKFYCTTEGILPRSKKELETYGGIECYLSFQLGKKSFIYDLKRFGEIQKQKINQVREPENDRANTNS